MKILRLLSLFICSVIISQLSYGMFYDPEDFNTTQGPTPQYLPQRVVYTHKKETPLEYSLRRAAQAKEYEERQQRKNERIKKGEHIETPEEYKSRKVGEQKAKKEHERERRKADQERLANRALENAKKFGVSTQGSTQDILRRVSEEKDRRTERHYSTTRKIIASTFKLSASEVAKLPMSTMRNMQDSANRQARNDALIARAIQRKPGERVSYEERLKERHAYCEAGVFDGGLCRTSDDLAYDYMKQTLNRSVEDVNRAVLARAKKY